MLAAMSVDLATLLTATETGALLGVTRQYVGQLADQGVLVREDGKYRLGKTVTAYIGFLKSEARQATRSAAESRVRDARAAEIELRTARQANKLCETEEMIAAMQEILGKFVSRLTGIPAQSSRDLRPAAACRHGGEGADNGRC
jgi:phage terminase Nu1 subunit (DNA packaging protein)